MVEWYALWKKPESLAYGFEKRFWGIENGVNEKERIFFIIPCLLCEIAFWKEKKCFLNPFSAIAAIFISEFRFLFVKCVRVALQTKENIILSVARQLHK